jgi:Fe-S-cluster containining protein
MRDGLLRRAIKWVARLNHGADPAIQRAMLRARGREPFVLKGECRRCAQCCEAPGIQVGRLVWYSRILRAAFLGWQKHVNGFALVEARRSIRCFIFRCTHFDEATRTCDSYDSRPGACRDYPRLLLYQPSPEMMPGCGYRAVAKNAAGLEAELRARNLPEEQLIKLRKGLYLE